MGCEIVQGRRARTQQQQQEHAMAMAMTTRTTLTGRGGEGEVGLCFNPNDDRRHGSLFFLFLSADPSSPPPPPPHRSLLFCPRLIIRPTNEYALSSPSASLSCTATALLPPSRGRPRIDVTRKEALWINNNRFNPHWVRARLPVMLQFQQRKPSAFSTPRGSDRLVRMEQLWQEFFLDPSQWWDNRLNKNSPRHPDFKHKRTLEVLWVDGWLNPSWVKEKMASMTLGHIQSGDVLRSRVPDSFCNGDKLSKLCEEGRLKEALRMLELMVQQTNKPPIHAYVCLLKGCSRRKALAEGKQVHALIVQSVLDSNIFLANTLVHMYSKCGSVLHAHKVFKNMPQHNVYSWTAIISAYADSGEVEEAINLFQQMQDTGLAPDKVLFVVVLKACASLASLEQGRKLHSDIIKRGFQSDVVVGCTLVNMYAKCGCTEDARELFDNLSERDVVSWNAMIGGYAQNGLGKEALALYEQMKQEGMQPNNVTFVLLLKACACLAALEQGKQLHSEIMKRGFLSGVVVGNILVDMYAKCGCTEDARELFDNMSERDVISWNAMIAGYAQNGLGKEALALYEQMKQEGVQPDDVTFVLLLKACASLGALEQGKRLHSEIIKRGFQSDVVVGSTLVNMYAKCGCTEDARELFDNMSERDVVSWTAMIAGYAQNGLGKEALALYEQMKQEGMQPNSLTLVLLLKACASLAALEQGKQLHSEIIKRGFQSDVVVGSTLVNMYAKCGCTEDARELFDNMSERDVISWNAMIAGYAQNGLGKEALALYEQMKQEGVQPDNVTLVLLLKVCASIAALEQGKQLHYEIIKRGFQSDVVVGSTLVNMYAKCGCTEDARELFDNMSERDVVSWTAMIAGHAQNGLGKEALALYEQMKQEGVQPDNVTLVLLLNACASLAALEQGKQLHSVIMKRDFQSDVVVGSTLVDMYAKCGCTEGARELFDNMSERDVVSWNAMIAGYAQNGLGKEALALFEQMQREGTKPNEVTYISVLSACAHSGLVDQGRYFFDSMCKNQGVTPTKEHYACMVDLLGRAGCLADAELFINKMPIQPDIVVWMTLLGAARNHGHAEIGRRAFDRVVQLDPKNAAPYVLLSNIYAAAGKKDELAKIRNQMKEAGVKKMPGCSWIEVDNQLHAFVVGDATHPQSKEIHAELDRLVGLMKMAGYKPNLSFVLDDVEDEKENALCGHSEKQAIAFGLINTPFGTPIRIKKNLRVCGDCHNATKIISKIVGRDISVMDANRNHHFKDGFCSCGDYW
ncbi:hypothetical protein O6H91_15G000800 [Diphasiastrum complanatum]|uniref:Uncharacterized protein n=1 Tax=Diphasiastrum complanatum TaxID=34168 RepID=A0ACC2BEZ2_DIPCM|nr:hypothetical protein O6H91_15G000800 [Diphasiastrum complanatum]